MQIGQGQEGGGRKKARLGKEGLSLQTQPKWDHMRTFLHPERSLLGSLSLLLSLHPSPEELCHSS